jgi:hypothetical protein
MSVVQAIDNSICPTYTSFTVLVKENYKLHYYFGYPEAPEDGLVKLFDLKSDPEELVDLYPSKDELALELLDELKGKLAEVNKPYL